MYLFSIFCEAVNRQDENSHGSWRDRPYPSHGVKTHKSSLTMSFKPTLGGLPDRV